ncbi:EAL domain-containing protein [Wenzhouxiangella sp. XN201]|uniref:EAL domain-containing protein n=1 Tax=Wenzhouxiangella sp. XN201 TaxID=2710755 RepID=UPI0013C8B362|nr:EAL domain-containing protein [Wenzhouxiangella sp. XN201]NEZ03725.1 EAL domain-containing protein [Wenzhouxiangella sp. XN201]
MAAGAEAGRGGVILIRFDRGTLLRDQLGFTGLSTLIDGVVAQTNELASELVGKDYDLVRFDWECLLLVLRDASASLVKEAAENLFSSLSDRIYDVGDDAVAVSVSLSFAHFDHRFRHEDELLLALIHRAEAIGMAGGNHMGEARPGISADKAISSADHMLGLLMESLRTDSLKVVFQPLLATSPEATSESYQMFPRLVAGDGRLLPAADFLPQAREAALLPVLDRWMIVHASRLLRGPLREKRVRLFINQSEALLVEAERQDWLARHLESEPMLAGRLVLEIPLEDAMAHLSGTVGLISICRDHDVGFCLSHVNEQSRWQLLTEKLKSDFLRMSPGFVKRLTQDPDLEERFFELSKQVREQGTRIIMPMIEDSKTAASMWRTGADYMQGNLIQAPEDTIAI